MGRTAAVVGGGFGGLAVASILARRGWDVTLLEKNAELGGRARPWRTNGFMFDMGPSWYLMPEVFDRFFAGLGRRREDYYDLYRLDPYYRVFFQGGQQVDISADSDQNRAVFESFQPGGAAKLDEYLRLAKYKYDIAMNEFLYKDYQSIFQFLNKKILLEGTKLNVFRSLDSFVSTFFSDPRARQILEYAMVFLGNSPSNAPALYSIMSHVDLNLGVYFPVGGMIRLVEGMARLARELGVRIETSAPVDRIVVESGKARAVECNGDVVDADAVVVNADYAYAETQLLAPEHQTYPARFWEKRTLAPTMFIIYLGLNRKIPALVHHNLYFAQPWDDHFKMIFDTPQWPENPCYYVSCASYDDEAAAPAGQENIFFLVPTSPRLTDDDSTRERYADKILDHFERLIGDRIRESIVVRRIYSHRDFAGDYNAFHGTSLGIAHTLFQTAVFRPAQRSKKVKDLFYVGQYTHPGVGVPMTMIAAQILGEQIMPLG